MVNDVSGAHSAQSTVNFLKHATCLYNLVVGEIKIVVLINVGHGAGLGLEGKLELLEGRSTNAIGQHENEESLNVDGVLERRPSKVLAMP